MSLSYSALWSASSSPLVPHSGRGEHFFPLLLNCCCLLRSCCLLRHCCFLGRRLLSSDQCLNIDLAVFGKIRGRGRLYSVGGFGGF